MNTPRIGPLVQIGESGQRATSLTRIEGGSTPRRGSGGQAADGTLWRSDVNRVAFNSRPRYQAAPHTCQEGVDRLTQDNPESGRLGATSRSVFEWCGETILAAWWLLGDRGE
jgi:hypothetical protein